MDLKGQDGKIPSSHAFGLDKRRYSTGCSASPGAECLLAIFIVTVGVLKAEQG